MDDFFDEPQGAAILKHKVLEVYVHIFARKLGTRVPVVLLDGYAGPGRYDDGSPGSPELLLAAARACRVGPGGSGRRPPVRCVFVEERPSYVHKLREVLHDHQDDAPFEVLPGKIEDCLTELVASADGQALLVFLDPFGLAIPFDMLTRTLLRPRRSKRGWQPTEVLLNFSINGVNRAAGRLDRHPPSPQAAMASQTRLDELTDFLGGTWWQPQWRSGHPDRVEQILQTYLGQIQQAAPGWQVLQVPVRDRWNSPVAYHLVLLTRHKQGLWFFADAVSRGAQALHNHTVTSQRQLTLAAPDELEGWVWQIERALEATLAAHPYGFNLGDEVLAVYGPTLGMAGAQHVKQAVERLQTQGRLRVVPPKLPAADLYKGAILPVAG